MAMKGDGLLDAGWDRINLDDCWSSQGRDSQGWLVPVPERFPHGMKPLAVQRISSSTKSLPFSKKAPKNLDLRCVLLPAPCVLGVPTKTRLE